MFNLPILHRHKNIVESFLSLSFINGVNILLPFISLPYMLHVIGPANYGIYTYVYTLIQYFTLIISYGFSFTATKQIAQHKDNEIYTNSIFNSVFFSKCLLFIVSLIFFAFISNIFLDTPSKEKQFLWGLGIVIGEILMPTYLYQGLEKMRYLAIINIIPKLIFTLLIFMVIKKPEDYEYIILLNSVGFILAGIISMLVAKAKFNVNLSKPNIIDIRLQLKEGLSVFASTLGINMYRNCNVIILGLFCSDSIVGIYSAAEKIIKAIQSLVTPLTQALFPHTANKLKNLSITQSILRIFKLSGYISIILFFICVILFFTSPIITTIILGDKFLDAIPQIKIMSLVVFFGGLNYILGVIGLIILGKGKQFFSFVIVGGITCVAITTLFSSRYSGLAASWGMSIAEFVVTILISIYLLYLYKKGIYED